MTDTERKLFILHEKIEQQDKYISSCMGCIKQLQDNVASLDERLKKLEKNNKHPRSDKQGDKNNEVQQ